MIDLPPHTCTQPFVSFSFQLASQSQSPNNNSKARPWFRGKYYNRSRSDGAGGTSVVPNVPLRRRIFAGLRPSLQFILHRLEGSPYSKRKHDGSWPSCGCDSVTVPSRCMEKTCGPLRRGHLPPDSTPPTVAASTWRRSSSELAATRSCLVRANLSIATGMPTAYSVSPSYDARRSACSPNAVALMIVQCCLPRGDQPDCPPGSLYPWQSFVGARQTLWCTVRGPAMSIAPSATRVE